MNIKNKPGFTLIELLVTIGIIGILVGIAAFALRGGQTAGRDTRRQADLEQIRASLELYRSDCGSYPATLTFGSALTGSGTPTSCTGNYMEKVSQDIAVPARSYSYAYNATTKKYSLCAALEDAPITAQDVTSCTSCTTACNYIVTNP